MDGGEGKGFRAGMPEMCMEERHLVLGRGFREGHDRRQAGLSFHIQQSSWYPKLPSKSLVKL